MNILVKDTNILTEQDQPITGSISIENNVIRSIGSIPRSITYEKVIDGRDFLAIPGLVNAHTHSPMCLFRNAADDLPFNSWLFDRIIPIENKLTDEDIYYGALLGICEMVRSGITCFCDMYISIDSIATAVMESGIRANLSYSPITASVRNSKETVDIKACESFIKSWHVKGNIRGSIEIHSIYLYEKESIIEAALLAKSLGVGVQTHLSESRDEVLQCYNKYSLTPIEAAESFQIFNVPTIAAHCVHLEGNDISILKRNNVSVVHCPTSNLKLGNGFAPIKQLLDANINVGIGTDGCASNNNLNMFEEMHIASLIHKGVLNDSTCIPASQVVRMATKNGAVAAGFFNLGELKVGTHADIVLLDLTKPHMCPMNNPHAALTYSAQASDVDTVIVGGKILMENRVLTFVDEERVMGKVREISKKILT